MGTWAGCGDDKDTAVEPTVEEKTKSRTAISGSRIAWDFSTLKRVSAAETGYNAYARVIQLQDKSLLCVYESNGRIVTVKSNDLGASWAAPVMVAPKPAGFNNTVPDILQLKDNSILVSYNPRPHDPLEPSKKFGIRTKKSYDGGLTWRDERLLYEAGYQFENGCWEPAPIQLPSGEVQVYFANEGPYTSSSEQDISMVRSTDQGLTWSSQPVTVSFRAGRRDGMPSPLLLQNGRDLVVAIEDNAIGEFKPYTVRTTVANNWKTPVSGTSPDRNSSLAEPLASNIYAGAPYIRQLRNGETIMSYQGTENRTNSINNAEMKVVLGNDQAKDFNRKTVPFVLPGNVNGLWNSVSVLEDNTVIALTGTKAYSSNNSTEVWMIKGRVIPELSAEKKTITVDGLPNEAAWAEPFPVFVGHRTATQLTGQLTYDDEFLYVLHKVKDSKVVSDSQDPEENDGVVVQLDPANKSYEAPGRGVYTFFLSANGKLVAREGQNGKWVPLGKTEGVKFSSQAADGGYVQEIAIPWLLLGGKPLAGARMGYNTRLVEDTGKGPADYRESISANGPDQPYTWLTLTLK
ncbi:sugar-binding protein [Rufibacter sp. XAAS-G3-1]|uniref:sugar-binding protein n=1 Tax=Rufibacter sp. XAAS-G3-1 TaxID=2729134 RepID=UPI0015E7D541|nr:sugar-binding protein [Rufibacter sp. XAAS-G3-1]